MLSDDELWEKCNTNQPITADDLGIKEETQGVALRDATKEERESVNKYIENISKSTGVNFYDNKNKLDYSDLREEIHKILCDFLSYEHLLQNDGEFDYEFLEFRTDDILRLIRRQGGSITK